jgi:hypothetical protein
LASKPVPWAASRPALETRMFKKVTDTHYERRHIEIK